MSVMQTTSATERGVKEPQKSKKEQVSERTYLLLLIGAAFFLRLDFLVAGEFRIDSDEAIVGLMAKHIMEGGALPVFYYGQDYMGSLEALLAAGVFSLFGVSEIGLKAVPLIFSLLLIPLVYALTLEAASRRAAKIAALLTAVSPAALVVWSAKARGGFIETLIIGGLSLLLTVRWAKSEEASEKGVFFVGLLLGLGWWVNNQILYFMLPIGLCMLSERLELGSEGVSFSKRTVGALKTFLVGLGAFFLGGLPYWIYNIANDFPSLSMFRASGGGDVLSHAAGLFSTAFPILFGAKRYWQTADVFPAATVIAWLFFAAAFTHAAWISLPSTRRLLSLRGGGDNALSVYILFLVGSVCVFCASSFGYLSEAPRYLLPLYVVLPIFAALMIEKSAHYSRVLSMSLLVGLVLFNLASCYLNERAIPGEPFVHKQERVAKDHTALMAFLDQQSIDFVKTNYWIGYRLAFETEERVRFVVFGQPGQVRIEDYEKIGRSRAVDQLPLVLVPSQRAAVESALGIQGYTYDVQELDEYVVIYNVKALHRDLQPVARDAFVLEASHGLDKTGLAADEALTTRWGSGHRQIPGMFFRVRLAQPLLLRAFRYDLGAFWHDYPRSLEIVLELADGSTRTLLESESYQALRYFKYGNTEVNFFFEPLLVRSITLRQLEEDPVFDWSIAELDLFR